MINNMRNGRLDEIRYTEIFGIRDVKTSNAKIRKVLIW